MTTRGTAKRGAKAEFVRGADPKLAASEVVLLAKKRGLALRSQDVYRVRKRDRERGPARERAGSTVEPVGVGPEAEARMATMLAGNAIYGKHAADDGFYGEAAQVAFGEAMRALAKMPRRVARRLARALEAFFAEEPCSPPWGRS